MGYSCVYCYTAVCQVIDIEQWRLGHDRLCRWYCVYCIVSSNTSNMSMMPSFNTSDIRFNLLFVDILRVSKLNTHFLDGCRNWVASLAQLPPSSQSPQSPQSPHYTYYTYNTWLLYCTITAFITITMNLKQVSRALKLFLCSYQDRLFYHFSAHFQTGLDIKSRPFIEPSLIVMSRYFLAHTVIFIVHAHTSASTGTEPTLQPRDMGLVQYSRQTWQHCRMFICFFQFIISHSELCTCLAHLLF